MKIRKLQLKNIGVFDDETIEFQPCPAKDKAEIHILTGQNGSGKSTILMALARAFQTSGDLQEARNERMLVKSLHDWLESSIPENTGEKSPLPLNALLKAIDDKSKKKENSFNTELKTSFDKRFRFFEYDGKEDFVYKDEDNFKSQIKITLNETDFVKIFASPTWWNSVLSHTSLDSITNYGKLVAANGISEKGLDFAVFAFSGYRQIQSESIEALKEPKEFNPLFQSLEFIKDYTRDNQLTINQLIANNISKSAIEKERSKAKSKKFAGVIKAIEQAVSKITNWDIEFDLETEPTNLIIRVNKKNLDFDVLPDGLRSLISWLADLLGRIDLIKWQDDLPITEKNLILFLDEIEVHLHPKWQRKVLPVIQKLFKNAQIFVSTHSPFVVNSVDDAWVYKLKLKDGKATVSDAIRSEDGISYQTVLSEILEVNEEFGGKTQDDLDRFYKIIRNGSKVNKKELLSLAKSLAVQSEELNSIVQIELRQFSRRKGQEFSI